MVETGSSERTRVLRRVSLADSVKLINSGISRKVQFGFRDTHQVICESANDARIYEALYRHVGAVSDSEVTLKFIGPGITRKKQNTNNGDIGTGKPVTKSLVRQLRDNGITTAFGLVDWDGHEEPGEGIFVMGHNEWYTLEYAILDPIAVLYGLETAKGLSPSRSLAQEYSLPPITELETLSDRDIEKIIDQFGDHVFGADYDRSKRKKRTYANERTLLLPEQYFLASGKEAITDRLRHAFGNEFKSFRNDEMFHICNTVLRNLKGFIPQSILDVFAEIERAS